MAAVASTQVERAERGEAAPLPEPRVITPAIRKKLGFPKVNDKPYPWGHAIIAAFGFGVPIALMNHPVIAGLIVFVALVFLPVWRKFEKRAATADELLYQSGEEAVARVLDVEPAGSNRRDHLVRVEYLVGEERVEARVIGAPLARQGLRPGEDVVVIHDRVDATRCLILERVSRSARVPNKPLPPVRIEDAADEPLGGGCGGGGCGAGACGKGGCGAGACGKGGCGAGGCC